LYDNYNWITDLNAPFSSLRSTVYDDNFSSLVNTYPYPQPLIQSNATNGLITGMRVTVPGTGKTIYTINYYDDKGRVIQTQSTITIDWKTHAIHQYDALGQLKSKTLSPDYNNGQGLESLVYDYNIRGWLLGMNREYLETPDKDQHYFGFDLGYDNAPHAYYGYY